jgi:hypothetical protein
VCARGDWRELSFILEQGSLDLGRAPERVPKSKFHSGFSPSRPALDPGLRKRVRFEFLSLRQLAEAVDSLIRFRAKRSQLAD